MYGTDLDFLFKKVGGFGRYQVLLTISEQWLALFACGFGTVIYSLGGVSPIYSCNDDGFSSNITDECDIRELCQNLSVTRRFEFNSYVAEYDLVCEREYIRRLMTSLSSGISVIYAFILGHVIDHFGRKWPMIFVISTTICFLLLGAFNNGWPMLMAAFLGTYISEAMCLAYFCELVTKRYRSVMAVATQWCLAYPLNSLLAYLVGGYRYYMLSVAVLGLPLLAFLVFFLVESPRWLIQKSKFERASKSLQFIAKVNQRSGDAKGTIEPKALATLCKLIKPRFPYNVLHLFSAPPLAIRLILQCIHYATLSIAMRVILFNIQALAGSPFLNVALLGILRLWVPFFVVWMDWKAPMFGRKLALIAALSIVTVCFLINTFIFLAKQEESLKVAVTVFSQISVLTLVSVYILMVQIYNVELFPTVLRSIAVACSALSSSIGGVIGPQILLLAQVWKPLPYVVVACICVFILAADSIFLPETRGKPLLESMENINHLPLYDHRIAKCCRTKSQQKLDGQGIAHPEANNVNRENDNPPDYEAATADWRNDEIRTYPGLVMVRLSPITNGEIPGRSANY